MPRPDKPQDTSNAVPIRRSVQSPVKQEAPPKAKGRKPATPACEDCRATTAFHAWHDIDLQPAFNVTVSFADWNIVPKGKRAVIELVTAEAIVPSGEWVRLRMNTSLGSAASNLDLALTFQGNVGDKAFYVGTHSLRA